MKPLIGVSSKVFSNSRWYIDAAKTDFLAIEISRRKSACFFHPDFLNRIKHRLKGRELSLHSATAKVFNDDPDFTNSELNTLKGEIYLAKYMGIKEIVFHLRQKKLTSKEKKQFRHIISYAKDNGVELLYEGNSTMHKDVILDFFDSFPEMRFNLDMGHLNLSVSKETLGCSAEEFSRKLSSRITYVHAHNNDGKSDQHVAVDKGTLDYKGILRLLDSSALRKVIIEVREMEDAIRSKKLLEDFYGKEMKNKKL